MSDKLIRAIAKDGMIRIFATETTELVDEASKIHDCTPTAAAALGRMLTAGTMMGAMLKSDKEVVTLQINGGGMAKGVTVTAYSDCSVKGYIGNPHVDLPLNTENGKLNVGEAIGKNGGLTVIKDLGLKDPYVQHDVDASVFGDKVGQIPRMDVYDFKADEKLLNLAKDAAKNVPEVKTYVGRIVSGDQFIADSNKVKLLDEEFNAKAVEMESAAIAQVAYINKIPFVIIRSISDNANNGAHMDYKEFIPVGVKNSTSILKSMFENM